jgi:hypothetical protein
MRALGGVDSSPSLTIVPAWMRSTAARLPG